jgi:hypothetical protein
MVPAGGVRIMKVSLYDLIEEIAAKSKAHVAVAIWDDIKLRLKEKFDQIDREDEARANNNNNNN